MEDMSYVSSDIWKKSSTLKRAGVLFLFPSPFVKRIAPPPSLRPKSISQLSPLLLSPTDKIAKSTFSVSTRWAASSIADITASDPPDIKNVFVSSLRSNATDNVVAGFFSLHS